MKPHSQPFFHSRVSQLLRLSVMVLFVNTFKVAAQEMPPKPISVYVDPEQEMSFGAFYPLNAGGTITISASGSRSTTGDVILINQQFTYSPASFQIEALPGTLINIQNGPDVVIYGSNGGTMTLHLESSDPPSPFITSAAPPDRTQVKIGGTLTVGNIATNGAGNYNGTFTIIFNQE